MPIKIPFKTAFLLGSCSSWSNLRGLCYLSLLMILCSCNVTKHLKEDEFLVTSTTIKYQKPEEIKNEKKFKESLKAQIKPQPNTGWLNLSLWIYQWGERSKKQKGFRRWLQRNFGEAPALYSDLAETNNRLRMKKLLKDNGFFRSDIDVDTTMNGKEVSVEYEVLTNGQYKINRVLLPSDTTDIGKIIHQNKKKSLLKSGDFYSEALLKKERLRISDLAAQRGYLDFNESFIYYFIDTIPQQFVADVYIKVKLPADAPDHKTYRLGKTEIYPNYDLSNKKVAIDVDTAIIRPEMIVIENRHLIDHKVLDRMILQNSNDVVIKKNQDVSVSHLLDLGIFKFVNLKYEKSVDSLGPIINRRFYLTPDYNQNMSANLELNNRTGRFYGIGASGSYRHLNVLKKAVTFGSTLSGGLETQIGSKLSFLNTIDLNVEFSVSAPRFIVPFKIKPNSGLFVPRTSLTVGNTFQRRVSLYSINSTNFKLGYQWRETAEKQHSFYPISINRVEVLDKTFVFDSLVNATPRLANSFQNSFLIGLDYTYIYTNQSADPTKDYWFFRGNMRTSGNLAQLAARAFDFEKTENGRYKLINLPFAQFTSLEADLRFYKKLNRNSLVFRFSPAVGFAYGNSTVLPYIEQFFVGGANSIRAFRLRDLGPGSFARDGAVEDGIAQQFIDQTGDVKLEMTAEYRFGILGFFKGAFFVDAGNVWLLNDGEEGKNFRFSSFWKEIAVGAGLGLRIDIEYIVLRLDVATPLRKPYFAEGFRWTFDRFDLGSAAWRKDNIIYNIAVGYPF